MAEDEEPTQTETAASSPSSQANQDQQPSLKLAKDRNCPFCGQAFTSSSLGRHLDLYIKPKNPKPADGVHDVEEIRKLRGGITRRQPRNSLKGTTARKEESVDALKNPSKTAEQSQETSEGTRTNHGTPAASPVRARESSDHRGGYLNAPSWHSTGVINNIPPRAPSRNGNDRTATGQAQRAQDMRRDVSSGQRIQRPEPETDNTLKLQEQAEVGRAAEMALREVLGSLQAAQKKIEPGPIYEDFDFFAQTFPGLCLAILPPPTTLFSPAPFASPESWSLNPPGAQQSDVLHRLFNERCKELRQLNPDHPTDSAIFRHNAHIQGAFENWRLMSEHDKQAAWTLEALRAFTTVRDSNKRLKDRISNADQHSSHLEAQYDRLSRCQLPRELLTRPPTTLPISSAVARDMQKRSQGAGFSESDYDPDALLAKWREVVRSVTRPARQPSAPKPSYANSAMRGSNGPDSLQGSMIISGAVVGVGGPMPRATDAHGSNMGPPLPPESVCYETPPNPGAIFEDEDGQQHQSPYNYQSHGTEDLDAELDEDVSNVLDTSITNFVDRNALAKQRRFVQGSFSGGSAGFGKFRANGSGAESPNLNANGKRPAEMPAYRGASKGQRT